MKKRGGSEDSSMGRFGANRDGSEGDRGLVEVIFLLSAGGRAKLRCAERFLDWKRKLPANGFNQQSQVSNAVILEFGFFTLIECRIS